MKIISPPPPDNPVWAGETTTCMHCKSTILLETYDNVYSGWHWDIRLTQGIFRRAIKVVFNCPHCYARIGFWMKPPLK